MGVLRARLGESLILARPRDSKLHILNASAAELWEVASRAAAADIAPALAAHLTSRRGLPRDEAGAIVGNVLEAWRSAGLLDAAPEEAVDRGGDWTIPPNTAPAPENCSLAIEMAGMSFGLCIGDAGFDEALRAALPLPFGAASGPCAQIIELRGHGVGWALHVGGATPPAASGDTLDTAVIAVLNKLVELVCRAEERLMVIHGAGVVMPGGGAMLLIAPGGSGKSTLAAALDADGWPLLSDDVVPVDLRGLALGLGAPMVLKRGSWRTLADCRPDLHAAATMERYGETVKLLAPRTQPPRPGVPTRRLAFPCYRAGCQPTATRLAPEEALRRIVEAEATIPDLSQAKLEALARWVEGMPAHAIEYSDLASGLALARALADENS